MLLWCWWRIVGCHWCRRDGCCCLRSGRCCRYRGASFRGAALRWSWRRWIEKILEKVTDRRDRTTRGFCLRGCDGAWCDLTGGHWARSVSRFSRCLGHVCLLRDVVHGGCASGSRGCGDNGGCCYGFRHNHFFHMWRRVRGSRQGCFGAIDQNACFF